MTTKDTAKEQAKKLLKVQTLIKKHWDKNNQAIKKIVELDERTLILNRPARLILQAYLDRFKTLSNDSTNPKVLKELATLLDSLEYLTKVLIKLSKIKKFKL